MNYIYRLCSCYFTESLLKEQKVDTINYITEAKGGIFWMQQTHKITENTDSDLFSLFFNNYVPFNIVHARTHSPHNLRWILYIESKST